MNSAALVPLETLPTEILEEIVLFYLSLGENTTFITQVYHRLRQIVLGMGSVWSKIRLQADIEDGPDYLLKRVR
jgi:hypothetical protein